MNKMKKDHLLPLHFALTLLLLLLFMLIKIPKLFYQPTCSHTYIWILIIYKCLDNFWAVNSSVSSFPLFFYFTLFT